MAEPEGRVLRLDSEAAAWDALRWLIANRAEAQYASVDLSDLSWTQVHFAFRGKSFRQTVTPSIMRGILEFQSDLYKSAALILRNDPRVIRLTDLEKSKLELIFEVKGGSSDLISTAKDQLEIFGKAMEKLSGRQVLIGFIVLLLVYFGANGINSYMDYRIEHKKIEAEEKGRAYDLKERKELYEFIQGIINQGEGKNQVLNQAYRASKVAAQIGEHNRHAFDEVVRNSEGADEVTIQSTVFNAETIQEITRSNRARSENVTIRDLFIVSNVDAENPESFTVRLDKPDGSQTIVAELEDPLISSRYQRAIASAEWSGNPVMVHIVGRRVGGVIKDAKIVRAYTPRKPRQK